MEMFLNDDKDLVIDVDTDTYGLCKLVVTDGDNNTHIVNAYDDKGMHIFVINYEEDDLCGEFNSYDEDISYILTETIDKFIKEGKFSQYFQEKKSNKNEIFDFDKTTGILLGYVDEIKDGLKNIDPKFDKYKDLVIPEEIDGVKVKIIDYGAFGRNQLTSVNIPNSVTEIGQYAFAGNQLISVTIPEGVKYINNSAFYNNELTSVEIGHGVKYIGNSAFMSNELTSVTIPEGVIEIGFISFDKDVEINRTQKPAKPKLKVEGEIKKVDKQASVKGQR